MDFCLALFTGLHKEGSSCVFPRCVFDGANEPGHQGMGSDFSPRVDDLSVCCKVRADSTVELVDILFVSCRISTEDSV